MSGWRLTLKDGTSFEFRAYQPVQAIQDRFGNRLTITRTNGRITQITSPNGRWISFTTDTNGRITQAKDNIGRTVTYAYDTSSRLAKVTDAAGGISEYTYDTNHRMLTVKNPRGITTVTNDYDSAGRLSKQTLANGRTWTFAYATDPGGHITQTIVTNPRSVQRQITFNAAGHVTTDTTAFGKPEAQRLTYTRNVDNLPTAVIDILNRKTTYTYDERGNITAVTRLAGTAMAQAIRLTYEPNFNQVTSVTDPLNHKTTFTYDAHGALASMVDKLNHTTTIKNDTAGRPIEIDDPLGAITRLTYDHGDLVAVTDPLGRTSRRWVDSAGRLTYSINSLGYVNTRTFDALNRITSTSNPLGGLTSFTYDDNGNSLTVTDARNNVTAWKYDPMDRPVRFADPLGRVEQYAYDEIGNPIELTDRRGHVATFSYDALDRLTKANFGPTINHTYTYDNANRIRQIVSAPGGQAIDQDYDELDRLTIERTPQGRISYGHDAANRQISMTVDGRPPVTYDYDGNDRLTKVTRGSDVVAVTFDDAGRRTGLTLPGGTVVSYGYDPAGQSTTITYINGSTTLGGLTYDYDEDGKRQSVIGSFARIRQPQAVSAGTYDAANQLTEWGTETLNYDANGNLTHDGTVTYTWDHQNRLSSTIRPSMIVKFDYDAFGRRVKKIVNGLDTEYLYDRHAVVQELSSGSPSVDMLNGLAVDEYFTRTDSAGSRIYLVAVLGSTVGQNQAVEACASTSSVNSSEGFFQL